MSAIFKKEMKGYFTGVIGYVFLVVYLAVAGIIFCYTTLFSMSADVSSYYTAMLLFSAIMLPILTMKTFSEERKAKTEQLILTAPVSITAMVFGKFLAAYLIYAVSVIFTSLYFLILIPSVLLFSLFFLSDLIFAIREETERRRREEKGGNFGAKTLQRLIKKRHKYYVG